MRRALPLIGTALAAVVLAPAAHGVTVMSSSFSLETADGWKATVSGYGGDVAISLYRRGAGATYTTDGTSGAGGIAADFEGFGDIYTTFTQEGEPVVRRFDEGPCRGRAKVRRGIFSGQIELVPEGAFTRLSATSARGRVVTQEFHCNAEPPDAPWDPGELEGDGSNTTILDAHHRSRNRDPYFEAVHRDRRPHADFFAGESHTVGDVRIDNSVSVRAAKRAFRFDVKRGVARVRPPQPFSGTASFTRRPGGRSRWRGDLSVALPSGEIPLTGREFRASLGRASTAVLVVGTGR